MSDILRGTRAGRSILVRLRVQRASAGLLALLLYVTPRTASFAAESAPVESYLEDASSSLPASPDPVRFLPGMIAAASGSFRASGFGWAGYDGATGDPLVGALAEARLGARLAISAGATYGAGTSLQPWAIRPSVMARLQVLDQRRHGIDAGVAVGFRQDRFVEEEGLFQASLAGGWRTDRTTVLANLGYGQDGEGDDHEGELRLAGLYRVQGGLHVGFDGHLRKLLNSTDPHLVLHGTPSLELTAGPVAALTVGDWVLTVASGVSGVRRGALQTGAVVVAGVGATY